MAYHLRYQGAEWALQHVVSRCINGYSFLKPTSEVALICAGVLGRSLYMYSDRIKLVHKAFLSNHFHLLLESKDAQSLAEFMKYFKSNLTRELGRVHDWQGSMWQSRYSNEEILDEESFIGIFKYITENSVKEGLVDHPRAWRGLHGFHQLVDQDDLVGPWIDRTGLFKAKARQSSQTRDLVQIEDFTTYYEVRLTKPRIWSEMSDDEYHKRCVELCDEAIKSARLKREGRSMGMARVLSQSVLRARKTKRGQRQLCRAKTIELLKVYKAKYCAFKRAFQAAYQQARDQVLEGLTMIEMVFPSGGIAPLSLGALSSPPQLE